MKHKSVTGVALVQNFSGFCFGLPETLEKWCVVHCGWALHLSTVPGSPATSKHELPRFRTNVVYYTCLTMFEAHESPRIPHESPRMYRCPPRMSTNVHESPRRPTKVHESPRRSTNPHAGPRIRENLWTTAVFCFFVAGRDSGCLCILYQVFMACLSVGPGERFAASLWLKALTPNATEACHLLRLIAWTRLKKNGE